MPKVLIFHKPHRNRRRENDFEAFLVNRLGGDRVNERYPIDRQDLDFLVSNLSLVASLERDFYLPMGRRQECINLLKALPAQIQVATDPTRVSFDIVVKKDGCAYYWEFHEEQHRTLTVGRLQAVYGPNGQKFLVPRFLQRLIRDVWRLNAFRDLTIVWCDWFESQNQSFEPVIAPGFREYGLSGRFLFAGFCTDSVNSSSEPEDLRRALAEGRSLVAGQRAPAKFFSQ